MPSVPRLGACRGLVALVLLASGAAACTRWEVQRLSPQQVVAEMKPTRMRVTRSDSTRLLVVQPQVVGDSLLGTVPRGAYSMPLSDVAGVAVRKGDAGGTIMLLVVIGAAGVAAGLVAMKIAMGSNY